MELKFSKISRNSHCGQVFGLISNILVMVRVRNPDHNAKMLGITLNRTFGLSLSMTHRLAWARLGRSASGNIYLG